MRGGSARIEQVALLLNLLPIGQPVEGDDVLDRHQLLRVASRARAQHEVQLYESFMPRRETERRGRFRRNRTCRHWGLDKAGHALMAGLRQVQGPEACPDLSRRNMRSRRNSKNRAYGFEDHRHLRVVQELKGDSEARRVNTDRPVRLRDDPLHRRNDERVVSRPWSIRLTGWRGEHHAGSPSSATRDQDDRHRDQDSPRSCTPLRLRSQRIDPERASKGVNRHRTIIDSTSAGRQDTEARAVNPCPAASQVVLLRPGALTRIALHIRV